MPDTVRRLAEVVWDYGFEPWTNPLVIEKHALAYRWIDIPTGHSQDLCGQKDKAGAVNSGLVNLPVALRVPAGRIAIASWMVFLTLMRGQGALLD